MTHGTLTAYTHHRCRCTDCRAANAISIMGRRDVKRAAGHCFDCHASAVTGGRCAPHYTGHLATRREYMSRNTGKRRARSRPSTNPTGHPLTDKPMIREPGDTMSKRLDSETGRYLVFHFMPDYQTQRSACGRRYFIVGQYHRRGVTCDQCRKSQAFRRGRPTH